jgi:hypothetical protein
MLIEMHTHTSEYSPCSKISAGELVQLAMDRNLNGIVLTDHHYLWREDKLSDLKSRLNCPDDFLLLSGQEVTTRDYDDVLVYGATDDIQMGVSVNQIRLQFPQAAIVWAHPYRGTRRPKCEQLFNPDFDGIEVLNRHHRLSSNVFALKEWKYWGFAALAGTDSHDANVGVFPSVFDADIKNIDDLVIAIKNNKGRPYLKSSRNQD